MLYFNYRVQSFFSKEIRDKTLWSGNRILLYVHSQFCRNCTFSTVYSYCFNFIHKIYISYGPKKMMSATMNNPEQKREKRTICKQQTAEGITL